MNLNHPSSSIIFYRSLCIPGPRHCLDNHQIPVAQETSFLFCVISCANIYAKAIIAYANNLPQLAHCLLWNHLRTMLNSPCLHGASETAPVTDAVLYVRQNDASCEMGMDKDLPT